MDSTHARSALRLAGALGLAHVVVVIAGFATQAPVGATLTSTREELADYYVEGSAGRIFAGGYVEVLGYLLFLPFVVALVHYLRSREPGGGVAASTASLAGVAFIAMILAPAMSAGAAALWVGQHGGSIDTVVALNALRSLSYAVSLLVFALFLAAVAVSALAGRSLPRGLSVSALVLAATLVVGAAGFAEGWADLPGLLTLVWVLAASIWALRARQGDGSPAIEPEFAGASRT